MVERKRVVVAEPEVEFDLPLDQKYRPRRLEDVVGQKEVVKSLRENLKSSTRYHSYLFVGPSGCGKTTLARILSKEFKVLPNNIIETDAATNNGIDDMREITSTLRYKGMGDSPNKIIILDEAHMLSKQAWNSLLKTIEEPPAHVFFVFCTTDDGKVPDTIKTRCQTYMLKSVKHADLAELLENVALKEDMDLLPSTIDKVARAANGSPRMALSMLSKVKDCDSEDEVARLLEEPLEDAEIIDLCRELVKGNLDWFRAIGIINKLAEPNPESIRIVVVNYINSCLLRTKSEKEVLRLLDILYNFSKPCNPTEKMAPILLALGDSIFK